jgi:hypothetical protein
MTPDNRNPRDDAVFLLLARIATGLMVLFALFALFIAAPALVEAGMNAWRRWGVVLG